MSQAVMPYFDGDASQSQPSFTCLTKTDYATSKYRDLLMTTQTQFEQLKAAGL